MSKKIQICTALSTKLEEIEFDKLYHTTNGITKATTSYQKQLLLIKTPQLYFGADVVQCGEDIYVDLVFDQTNKKNNEFLTLIRNIDYLAISEIYENSHLWYPEQQCEVSLCQVEKDYIPSIKLSTVHRDRYSLKLKTKLSAVEFFDTENSNVPYQYLKENLPTTCLLQLSDLYKEGSHSWIEWKIMQLKTQLPEKIPDGCQLLDIEDDDSSDNESIGDIDFY